MKWKEFFKYEANQYDQEPFTQATEKEVKFLMEQFGWPRGASILDMGCGTGRHSVALAKRGFAVTGVDLSEDMLDKARAHAKSEGVNVNFIQHDAATF